MSDFTEMLRLARMPVEEPPMIKIGPNSFARFADVLKATSKPVGSFGGIEVREDPLLPRNMGAIVHPDGRFQIIDFRTDAEREEPAPPLHPGRGVR